MRPLPVRDPELLRTALTVPRANAQGPDYQRLEYLGDAVLQLLASDAVYRRFPGAGEGELSEMRCRLVSGKALQGYSERLAVAERLAAQNPGVPWPPKALADATEALFGAAWLDGGLPAAQALFDALYAEADLLKLGQATHASGNPKGALLEYAQRVHHAEPAYALLEREGPDHAPRFRCAASLAGQTAEGEGPTRRTAEAEAARRLLQRLLPGAAGANPPRPEPGARPDATPPRSLF